MTRSAMLWAFSSASRSETSRRSARWISSPRIASRDRYSGTGGRGHAFSMFFFASLSTTLTIGDVAAASGSAETLKRGATWEAILHVGFHRFGRGHPGDRLEREFDAVG